MHFFLFTICSVIWEQGTVGVTVCAWSRRPAESRSRYEIPIGAGGSKVRHFSHLNGWILFVFLSCVVKSHNSLADAVDPPTPAVGDTLCEPFLS